jgi:hypothetical protein
MRRIGIFSLAVMVVFLAMLVPARGQEQGASQKTATAEPVRKILQVKYVDPHEMTVFLSEFGARLRSNHQTNTISVIGSEAQVEAVEEALKKLDVPPPPIKDIEITAYFLLATQQAVQTTLPSELDEVVVQLRRVLKYQHFRLLNTALVRARDGEGADVSGVASAVVGGGKPADFRFGFKGADIIADGKPRSIRLHGLDFFVDQEVEQGATKVIFPQPRTILAKIHTELDVPEGQKVVVGKTSFDSPDDALVLVLTAKVLD